MKQKKDQVADVFNRSADQFDRQAVIQKRMAHRIVQTLDEQKVDAREILEVGCGTGYLTQLLTDQFPEAQLTVVDLSEKMVRLAQQGLEESCNPSIRFVVADAEAVRWEENRYDLVVSNATIHWFNQPLNSVGGLVRSLKPGGFFVASTFGPDTWQELQEIYNAVIDGEEALSAEWDFDSLRTVGEWEDILIRAGLVQTHSMVCWHRKEYRDCAHFLQTIQTLGGSCVFGQKRFWELKAPPIARMMERYDRAYRQDQGVYATYQLIQLFGWKERSQRVQVPL